MRLVKSRDSADERSTTGTSTAAGRAVAGSMAVSDAIVPPRPRLNAVLNHSAPHPFSQFSNFNVAPRLHSVSRAGYFGVALRESH